MESARKRSTAALYGAYYFAFFGALGAFWPYFSLWLVAHGLSRAESTRILSLVPTMTLLAPPVAGLVADAWRLRGWLLRIASTAAFAAFVAFAFVQSRAAIYAATAIFAFWRSPIIALVDAATVEHVRVGGGSYGRIRVFGSIGFLVAALAAGVLVERRGPDAVVATSAAALAAGALLAFAMPAAHAHHDEAPVRAWRALVGDRGWWLFLVAPALGYMAMATYDSGFSLHLAALGRGGRFIGAAWAVGVGGEILLMTASRRIVEAIGAARLFTLTLVTGAVRWTLLARLTSPVAILCLQPLHGVTFGLFWVAGVTLSRERGRDAPTAAQGLFNAAIGLGSLVGMNATGRLLDEGGGALLYAAAGACAAVAAVASWLYARSRT